jgi:hypothetical protein
MISVSQLSGYKFLTTFTTIISPSSSDTIVAWGDNTFSHTSTATHVYSANGIFNLVIGNCVSTSSFYLSVLRGNYLENNINVTYNNILSAYAGCPKAFNISLSSITPSATVFLYASGSKSVPYMSNRTFWSHLNPEWEFQDVNNNPISELTMMGTAVYNTSSQLLGYSALSTVYYIDDMPGNPILFFTMKIDEYNVPINSRVYSALAHAVSSQNPSNLKISADGLANINPTQWADRNIPYTVTVQGQQCDTIVYNASGYLTQIDIIQNCFGINTDNYTQFLSTINLTDSNCRPTGGYSINNLFLSSSFLSANNLVNDYSIDPCDYNIENIEFHKTRKSPLNVVLSAHGIFNINGTIYSLSGTSTPFNIYPLENIHKYYKKGEEKTTYDILQKYSHFDLSQLPEFDNYLKVVTGEEGIDFYGKTQNFMKDTVVVDLCTTKSLRDIATKKAITIDDFGLSFPIELEKAIDDFSISLPKLIGTRCVCNNNFNCQNCCGKNICSVCGFDKKSNLGTALTTSSVVSANQTILIREEGSDVYDFYSVTQNTRVANLTGFPFDDIGINKFCFFQWNNFKQNNPVEGIINYKDPRNCLNSALSSNNEWYNNDGVIEEVLNYILTKNLIDE